MMYDAIIIGAGPSGMTAGLYLGRAGMKVAMVENLVPGGQMLTTDIIENFPGFPTGAKGPELAEWMSSQAVHFGAEVITGEAREIIPPKGAGGHFKVVMAGSEAIEAIAVVVATGCKWNELGVPGEKEFTGRGVSYCGTCDGPLFKNKSVVVVGGGDSAIEEAIFLTRFVKDVTIVHRRSALRAAKVLQDRARANGKIRFCMKSVAVGINGKGKVESVRVMDVDSGEEKDIKCDGVFIFIGMKPNSGIVKGLIKTCPKDYIITDDQMKTSMDGIFACGDVRLKYLRQVVTAAGDGAMAASSAQHYVESSKGEEYK